MAWTETGTAPNAILTEKIAQSDMPMGKAGSAGKAGGGQIHAAAMPSQPYARPNGTPTASRPVYPYPFIARYTGHGDVNSAANYHPVKTSVALPMTFDSYANSLIGPDNQKDYTVRDGKLAVQEHTHG